jgi:hypothetical protein
VMGLAVVPEPHPAIGVALPVPNWPDVPGGWGFWAKTSPAEESSRQAPIVTDDIRYFMSGFLLSKL